MKTSASDCFMSRTACNRQPDLAFRLETGHPAASLSIDDLVRAQGVVGGGPDLGGEVTL